MSTYKIDTIYAEQKKTHFATSIQNRLSFNYSPENTKADLHSGQKIDNEKKIECGQDRPTTSATKNK